MTKLHAPFAQEPLPAYREYPPAEMVERARNYYREMQRRRTVRDFDSRPVPREVIEQCLLAAGTAPSGANQQPWFFSVITDPTHKQRVREAAEVEERSFYNERAPQEWLDALAPLGFAGRRRRPGDAGDDRQHLCRSRPKLRNQ